MPHIPVPANLPGIRGLVAFRPEMGRALYDLAEALLVGDSPLSRAERELIAAYVSSRNNCTFCTESHAAASRHLFGAKAGIVDEVLGGDACATPGEKLTSLLAIAGKVQQGGLEVTEADIEQARRAGANDQEIHDTVLVAAAFCMFNRYVDGLASWTPTDPAMYADMGRRMAEQGYAGRLQQILDAR